VHRNTSDSAPIISSSFKTATDQLDVEIATLEAQLRYIGIRGLDFVLIAFAIFAITYAIFGRTLLTDAGLGDSPTWVYTPLIGTSLACYAIFGLAYRIAMRDIRNRSLHQDLEVLRARKRALINPKDPSAPLPYFDRLVNINVSNLEAYYTMVKVHTNNSFLASISAGCIGFLLIFTGLIVGFTGLQNSQSIAFISAGSGVITEFISGVFFYLYNRTTRQLKEYHDSLVDVQNILLSFKIVQDTSDNETRVAMTKSVIETLIASKKT
jgi:Cyanobacterial TRADD-N associated 2-Transmembrane domain